jgi:flagellar P-ring protein FlgI
MVRPRFWIACAMAPLWAGVAQAERIKDLGQFAGLRSNQLTGYGVVVGLAGTGDDNLDYATLGLKSAISRFGFVLPPGLNPALKNAAAVMLTAELPPFSKTGQRLDVTVSAIGKAKSLRGGTLIMAPLYGADSKVYAMAQGNLVVGGMGIEASNGSQIVVNIPSAGRIDGGATVERTVESGFATAPSLIFNLHRSDLSNARALADAINQKMGGDMAEAIDGGSVSIPVPPGAASRVAVMSEIENIEVKLADPPARVIVNARTGTVVISGRVRVGQAAIAHGTVTVRINEQPLVSQPAPLSRGETVTSTASTVSLSQERHPLFKLDRGADLSDVINAFNRIGVGPGDLVAILQALKDAGALTAELVII